MIFVKFILVAIMVSTSSQSLFAEESQAILTFDHCKKALAEILDFGRGALTDKKNTPDQFFKSHLTESHKPRLVLLIGPPGSGKSTWAKAATLAQWHIINNDAARHHIITSMRDRGELLEVKDFWNKESTGKQEVPDPQNPAHLFSQRILADGEALTRKMFFEGLANKKSIVIDALNSTPLRLNLIREAVIHGYSIEGLVFVSNTPDNQIANTAERNKQAAVKLTEDIVKSRWRQFQFYNSLFEVNPSLNPQGSEFIAEEKWIYEIPFLYLDIANANSSIEIAQRKVLDQFRRFNVFNRLEFVWVPKFNSMP